MLATAEPGSPTVVVIDDDGAVREALRGLFRSVGLDVEPFDSVSAYVTAEREDRPGCMVLDVRLPGQSGLEFQDQLVRSGSGPPVIFISGHADVETSVRAMKAGAIEFFTKPVREQDLLDAVQRAIDIDAAERRQRETLRDVAIKYDSLTPRERDVLHRVAAGLRNKAVALELGVSEATIKLHRANIMLKLDAASLVELVRFTDAVRRLSLAPSPKV